MPLSGRGSLLLNLGKFECILLGKGRSEEAEEMQAPPERQSPSG